METMDVFNGLTEDALAEATTHKAIVDCTAEDEDPYGLQPPTGRTLRRMHENQLAHVLLTGLSLIQEDGEREVQLIGG